MKYDEKFEEELTCQFKIDMRMSILNFIWWHWISIQHLKENWLVLPKMTWGIYEIWPEHVWKSKTWQSRMILNFKRNWLVSSKLTGGIWQILIRAPKNLKHLHFNGLLLNKVYNVWAKKSVLEFCFMTLNIDATFEGKLTCVFKNDMRNLANFHPSSCSKV